MLVLLLERYTLKKNLKKLTFLPSYFVCYQVIYTNVLTTTGTSDGASSKKIDFYPTRTTPVNAPTKLSSWSMRPYVRPPRKLSTTITCSSWDSRAVKRVWCSGRDVKMVCCDGWSVWRFISMIFFNMTCFACVFHVFGQSKLFFIKLLFSTQFSMYRFFYYYYYF